MEKRISVVRDNEIVDTTILPATTSAELLQSLGIPQDFWVSRKEGSPFGSSENLYELVQDGEKLWISPRAEVAGS